MIIFLVLNRKSIFKHFFEIFEVLSQKNTFFFEFKGLYIENLFIFLKNACQKGEVPRCKSGNCTGIVKPNIVFYGEDLPDSFFRLKDRDLQLADCLIVMGTSLEVHILYIFVYYIVQIFSHLNKSLKNLI